MYFAYFDFQIIENIPAKTVNRFLLSMESEAACRIQTAWRGFKVRQTLAPELANHKRVLAAVKIQRQVTEHRYSCPGDYLVIGRIV